MNKTLRVKLYGESLKIHKIELNNDRLEQFNEVANKLKEPLNLALLNIDFFKFLNIEGVHSLADIINGTFYGLINNNKAQIEISYGRKKIDKFKLDELFRATRLFPLFISQTNTIKTNNLKTGIYIVEQEIGLVGRHEVEIKNFNTDLLKFYLTEIEVQKNNYELLNIISYKNQSLPCIKSDILLTSQYSFIVE